MGLAQTTRNKIDKAVNRHEEFKFGNVSAKRYETGDYIPMGKLPSFLQSQLSGLQLDYDVYVVYSYQTPIGWTRIASLPSEWFIPTQYYSNTTTHHQHMLMWATNYKRDIR